MSDWQYLLKFIMIGDSNVGKSCLLMRLLQGRFQNQHDPTLGVQFGSKVFQIKGKKIKLQVWDTAGQQSFKSITRAYYKGSIGAILVYDVSSQTSFNNLQNWLYELKNHSHQKINIVLVGNKSDLKKQRQVSQQTARNFAKKYGIDHYFQTSAMTGQNVQRPFLDLGIQVLKKIDNGLIDANVDSAYGIKKPKAPKNFQKYNNITLARQQKNQPNQKCAC